MDVRLPDGTIIRNVPDGTSKADLTAKLKANGYDVAAMEAQAKAEAAPPKPEESTTSTAARTLRLLTPAGQLSALTSKQGREDLTNATAGGLRGAGSIGATVVRPFETGEQNAQRRQAMDNALESMGADPQSAAYKGGKLTTEVGGTLPIGGVVGKAVGTVAPRLGQAIASGGFSTGAARAPGVGNALVDIGIRSTGGAVAGGATAGAINPEDAGLGAVIGGALPPAARLAGELGRGVGAMFSPTMARTNALNRVASALGDDAGQAVADIQTYYPRGAEGIPVTAAAATKNPALAQLEQGSRLRSSPAWHDFDVRQGQSAYDNVLTATREAEDLGKRAGDRAANWQAAWESASDNLKPRLWKQRMTQFGEDLGMAMRSPEASNPRVRAVLQEIEGELDRVGPDFSIGHLQQMRANLNGKTNSLSPDAFASAPRDNPAIISLKKEMDAILNAATGGKWQKVIEGYAKDSTSLHAAKASQKVRNAYTNPETGQAVGAVINGDIPRVTAANLRSALNASRLPDKSSALSAEATQRLEATVDALRRQGMVQELKRSASAGGGSDTIPNAIAEGAARVTGAPNLLLQAIGAARQVGMGRTDNALARLLMNPDDLALALEVMRSRPGVSPALAGAGRALPALAVDR